MDRYKGRPKDGFQALFTTALTRIVTALAIMVLAWIAREIVSMRTDLGMLKYQVVQVSSQQDRIENFLTEIYKAKLNQSP
jgi:hypothetical protein